MNFNFWLATKVVPKGEKKSFMHTCPKFAPECEIK